MISVTHARLRSRVGALALALALVAPTVAHGAGTTPVLTITQVNGFGSSAGARTLVVNGDFRFDDELQFSFPAGLIVHQADRFVRYDLGGALVEGTSPLVVDGIDASEIPALLLIGNPAAAPATAVHIGHDRLAVVLPGSITAGAVSAVLYVVLNPTDAFVSNTVSVSLP